MLLDAEKVTGRQLMLQLQNSSCGALCPGNTAELPPAAQDEFAVIVDYLRDCMDCIDEMSQRDILKIGDSLDGMISKLAAVGFCLCSAYRDTTLIKADPTRLPCQITYVFAAPKDHPSTMVKVARKVSW
jgi:hypothetical protein